MIEVIVISENNTSVEMIKTVGKVLGKSSVKNFHPLVIKSNFSRDKVCGLIDRKIKSFRGKIDGVLLMTEVYGSTQSNLCMTLLARQDVHLISGYNLPMLIKAATLNQTMSLKKLAPELKKVGRKYIEIFNGK
jgi:PTS system mannose-specific IIA component